MKPPIVATPDTVLMLTPDRQIDRRILLQADSLEADGWAVIIVAMPLDAPVPEDPRVVRVGSGAGEAKRENLVLNAYRWVRGHVPMNGVLMRWLKRLAWRYLVDQESFYAHLFDGTVSRFTPAVVVANDLPMLPVARKLAAKCGARLVYDSHELYCEQEFPNREKRRWAEIEARHISACDVVITVNQSIATELEQRYGIRGVHVVMNAERPAQQAPGTRAFHHALALPASSKVLLMQGGLSAGRNLEVLVQAMALVRDPSVVLVILGDGLLLKRLQRRAEAQAPRRVFFHAAVPQSELLNWTVAADAGVIPYQATCLNNYFCTPNKLFEFIAAGIPVLASDLPEIRKLVVGENIGLVGEMGTAEKVAVLIDDFFGDLHRFGVWQHRLQLVRQRVSWVQEEAKLVEIYRALR
ncbi:MAG: glycosyltransferase [Betaproteobacteria bacterium]